MSPLPFFKPSIRGATDSERVTVLEKGYCETAVDILLVAHLAILGIILFG